MSDNTDAAGDDPEVIIGESRPLLPDNAVCDRNEAYQYDERGFLVDEQDLPSSPDRTSEAGSQSARSCRVAALNGSWYLQLIPEVETASRPTKIHGAMRIDSRTVDRFRVSGDVYMEEYTAEEGRAVTPIPENPLTIGDNWYPQFPPAKYGWYFRSQGVRYRSGRLTFNAARHVWDHRSDDFSDTETGSITLRCRRVPFTHPSLPQSTIRMRGTATFGDTQYTAVATKTSPYYRGCLVETDVMTNREWTGTANTAGGTSLAFSGVYREADFEIHAVIDEVDVPEDMDLTLTELQQLLATHHAPTAVGPHGWHLWLVVASQLGNTGTLGIMFDDVEPFREGTAAFYDPRFGESRILAPSARGRRIGEVPLAILRTALHEVGHAFNLYHPKHDVHTVPIGSTVMNQTGDVMGFASETNPYPDNAIFAFNDHNRTSLVHAPDPQIKPGWKKFGYNHGSIGNAPDEPHDLTFDRDTPEATDVEFELSLPDEVYPGKLPIVDIRVRNTGTEPREVTTALNLGEDYLSLFVKRPERDQVEVRDLLVICSDRQTVTLDPSETLTSYIQLLYTNRGTVFKRPGRYTVMAELDLGDRVVRSAPAEVYVRSPITEDELEVSMHGQDREVGRAIALGILPIDQSDAEEKLVKLAEDFPTTDLGTAAAIVVANARRRDVRDYRTGEHIREADDEASNHFLDLAVEEYDPTRLTRIATAMIPHGERQTPLLDQMLDRFEEDNETDGDLDRARSIVADFRAGIDNEDIDPDPHD